MTLTNCTIAFNGAVGGLGGRGLDGANVFGADGTPSDDHSVANGQDGVGGNGGYGGSGGSAIGGGVANSTGARLTISGTLFSANSVSGGTGGQGGGGGIGQGGKGADRLNSVPKPQASGSRARAQEAPEGPAARAARPRGAGSSMTALSRSARKPTASAGIGHLAVSAARGAPAAPGSATLVGTTSERAGTVAAGISALVVSPAPVHKVVPAWVVECSRGTPRRSCSQLPWLSGKPRCWWIWR